MKLRLRRLDPRSFAIIQMKIYLLLGIVLAVFLVLVTAFSSATLSGPGILLQILVCLVGYPLIAFVGGLILAWVYNFLCLNGGGIEFEVDRLDQLK